MTPKADFEQTLQRLLSQRPFQPFLIESDHGDRFVVGEPEALWYHGGGSAVYLRPDGSFDFVYCEAVKAILELKPVVPSS
ncbi:MAG: hypothetical protein L0Z62_47650 [Gemmataceae bacterium]|nr:hypothetical protein [Gemmataceae bacterium]